jgi:glycine hydroxymethyltransferase
VFPGIQGGPLMHVVAGKAVAFGEALKPEFRQYIEQVLRNAKVLAEELLAGRVPGGERRHRHAPRADRRDGEGLGRSARPSRRWDAAGITVNKNMIPFDPRKPLDPSGVRMGTPALTTRGMREGEMKQIVKWITAVIESGGDVGGGGAGEGWGTGAEPAVPGPGRGGVMPLNARGFNPGRGS